MADAPCSICGTTHTTASDFCIARFERLAAEFYEDTGFLAPGKDYPAAYDYNKTVRERAWHDWRKGRNRGDARPLSAQPECVEAAFQALLRRFADPADPVAHMDALDVLRAAECAVGEAARG